MKDKKIENKKVEIDVSGRIDQKSCDSVIVMLNENKRGENESKD